MGILNPNHPNLTAREKTIAELAAQGLTDREIAVELKLSVHTVNTYWARMRERFKTKSKTAVVAQFIRQEANRQIADLQSKLKSASQKTIEAQSGEEILKQLNQLQDQARAARKYEYTEETLTLLSAGMQSLSNSEPFTCLDITDSTKTLGMKPKAIRSGKESTFTAIEPTDLSIACRSLKPEDKLPGNRIFFLLKHNVPTGTRHMLYVNRVDPDHAVRCLVIDVEPLVQAGIIQPNEVIIRQK